MAGSQEWLEMDNLYEDHQQIYRAQPLGHRAEEAEAAKLLSSFSPHRCYPQIVRSVLSGRSFTSELWGLQVSDCARSGMLLLTFNLSFTVCILSFALQEPQDHKSSRTYDAGTISEDISGIRLVAVMQTAQPY